MYSNSDYHEGVRNTHFLILGCGNPFISSTNILFPIAGIFYSNCFNRDAWTTDWGSHVQRTYFREGIVHGSIVGIENARSTPIKPARRYNDYSVFRVAMIDRKYLIRGLSLSIVRPTLPSIR